MALAEGGYVQARTFAEQQEHDGAAFPLCLTPSSESTTYEETKAWFHGNKPLIEDLLAKHGAILFRGFPINNPEDFDALVNGLGYKNFPYEAGNAPRKQVN